MTINAEHLTAQSNEAIQGLTTVYNVGSATLTNLNVTGKITCGNTTIQSDDKGELRVNRINMPGSSPFVQSLDDNLRLYIPDNKILYLAPDHKNNHVCVGEGNNAPLRTVGPINMSSTGGLYSENGSNSKGGAYMDGLWGNVHLNGGNNNNNWNVSNKDNKVVIACGNDAGLDIGGNMSFHNIGYLWQNGALSLNGLPWWHKGGVRNINANGDNIGRAFS